jgi:para-aminobenzoate synthetase/4-amino-4-deoxychorismate lyase
VDRLFDIESYPTVWQMVSEISARLGNVGLLAILKALFPCGSITGAPKIRAMQIISELEGVPRALYTGALGWIAPNGDFRLNVAIRTLALSADGRGRMGIGSGIVADSEAQSEWQECSLKARFLRDSDPGLQLIETMRCEEGVWPYVAEHRARLRRSADWLGFPLDEILFEEQLRRVPLQGVWRVRLTLDKEGEMAMQHVPLVAESLQGRTARQATERIDSTDPLRRHKTTSRSLYDAALRALPAASPVFDVLFLNERGEVAEGARSTVFVERDGILLTPPISSGALPGVLRAALLASGRAREAVLYPEDLSAGFFLGNALRGVIPVTLEAAMSCAQE